MMESVSLAFDVYETPDTVQEKCPIIFLHGLFFNKYMLRDLAKKLCDATRRKVYCLDLRNHDQSPFCEECNSLVMVADIKRFVEERKLEKVVFVCHSFSSTLAYLFHLDQPEAVEKLVMVDHPPVLAYSDVIYKMSVYPQFAAHIKILKTLDPNLSLEEAKQKIRSLRDSAPTVAQKIFFEKMAYELIKIDNKFDWKTNHSFLTKRYKDGYFTPDTRGSSNHDILIIVQEDQAFWDQTFDTVKKYNPKVKKIAIPGTTHLLMFEKPDEFVKIVQDFLS